MLVQPASSVYVVVRMLTLRGTLAPSGQQQNTLRADPSAAAQLRALVGDRHQVFSQLADLKYEHKQLVARQREPGGSDPKVAERLIRVEETIVSTENVLRALDARIADLSVAGARAVPVVVNPVVPGAALPGPVSVTIAPPVLPQWLRGHELQLFAAGAGGAVLLLALSAANLVLLWRRSKRMLSAFPRDVAARFQGLEQSIESVALEVERLGEAQRYNAKLLGGRSESVSAGEPSAHPAGVPFHKNVSAGRP